MDLLNHTYPDFNVDNIDKDPRNLVQALIALRNRVIGRINALVTGATVANAEWLTQKRWHDGKDIYAKRVSLGALPNATSANTAHSVSPAEIVGLSGMADDGSNNYVCLPHVDTAGTSAIELVADHTNITVVTEDDRTGWTGWVIVEYTK